MTAVMASAVARLLFYPTLGYNLLMEKFSSRRWFDRVDETILLGALPFRSMTSQLIEEENVRGVITMNQEFETKRFCNSAQEWRALGVQQLRLSTVDLVGVPTLDDLHRGVAFALTHRREGTSVYVHCKAGRCRSATVVAAYLIQLHRWTPDEAIQRLKRIRGHVLLHSAHRELLKTFYQEVCEEHTH